MGKIDERWRGESDEEMEETVVVFFLSFACVV
jgi:hypothetical protein